MVPARDVTKMTMMMMVSALLSQISHASAEIILHRVIFLIAFYEFLGQRLLKTEKLTIYL